MSLRLSDNQTLSNLKGPQPQKTHLITGNTGNKIPDSVEQLGRGDGLIEYTQKFVITENNSPQQ